MLYLLKNSFVHMLTLIWLDIIYEINKGIVWFNNAQDFNYIFQVSQLDPSGLFQQSGHIKTGDTILLINGEIVSKDNADAILESLENSESHLVCVVISRSTSLQSKGDNSVPTPVTNLPHSPTSDENANKKSKFQSSSNFDRWPVAKGKSGLLYNFKFVNFFGQVPVLCEYIVFPLEPSNFLRILYTYTTYIPVVKLSKPHKGIHFHFQTYGTFLLQFPRGCWYLFSILLQ